MNTIHDTVYWIQFAVAESITCLNHPDILKEYEALDTLHNRWNAEAGKGRVVDCKRDVPALYGLASRVRSQKLKIPNRDSETLSPHIWNAYTESLEREAITKTTYHISYRSKVLLDILQDPVLCRSIDSVLLNHSWILTAYPMVREAYDKYTSNIALVYTTNGITQSEYVNSGNQDLYSNIDPLMAVALKYHDVVSQIETHRVWNFKISRILCSFMSILESASISYDYQFPSAAIAL